MKELKNNVIIEAVFPVFYVQNTEQLYSHERASSTGYKVAKKVFVFVFIIEIITWFI